MNTDLMFSKKSDSWGNPAVLYDSFISKGYFDPCPLYHDMSWDGLKVDWSEFVFVNPPYSDIRSWLEKGIREFESGRSRRIVFLVPARVDTRWFHDLVYGRFRVEFIKGRLKFGDGKSSAPFPSMWVFIE